MFSSNAYRFLVFFFLSLSVDSQTVRAGVPRELKGNEPIVTLGTAGGYAILTKAGISTVPSSVISGNIAVSPIASTAITGFDPMTLDGGGTFSSASQITGFAFAASYAAPTPAILTAAVGDMGIAYADAASRLNPVAARINLLAGNLVGSTLSAGVWTFTTPVVIGGDITFDGDKDAIFIIQIAQTLSIGTNVKVALTGGALASNIFWQVAGAITVEVGAHMEGILLGATSAVFKTGSSLNGRILVQTACTLDAATINSFTKGGEVSPAAPTTDRSS
jgi:hypothetical protein